MHWYELYPLGVVPQCARNYLPIYKLTTEVLRKTPYRIWLLACIKVLFKSSWIFLISSAS